MSGLFRELGRRNVYRVGIAYLVVAWLVMQVVSVLVPLLEVPDWVGRAVLVLLLAGFPVALIIAWAFELTPEGLRRTPTLTAGEVTPPARLSRKWDFVIIGALVAALGITLWSQRDVDSASRRLVEDRAPSIGVLPFVNLSSDPEQDYFSDGLAEELLNALAKLEGLQVASRTSSFLYKNSEDDVQTIAAQLDVDNVLEGSVRKAGDQIRVTAQLIDAATGFHLWSEVFDRELDDIFAIQEEIAESVASALSVTLGVGDRERMSGGTQNVEAFDHYLQALALLNELGNAETVEGIDHLERAVDLDPSYADAWSLLSLAYMQAAYMVTGDFEGAKRRATDTAETALALDANLAAAHAALGNVHFLNHEWAEAEEEFLTAIAIPSDATSTWDYANLLGAAGYLEEALEYRRVTRRVLSLNVAPAVDLAETYLQLGEYEAARESLSAASDLTGSQDLIPGVQLRLQRVTSSREDLRARLAAANGEGLAGRELELILSIFEEPGTADDAIRAFVEAYPLGRGVLWRLSDWAAYFGAPELAVELVSDSIFTVPLFLDRLWEPQHSDTRRTEAFKALVRELGLVDWWRERGWPTRCRPVEPENFECS
jgi:TolB-like protein/Flp pilus assembly protein TadD